MAKVYNKICPCCKKEFVTNYCNKIFCSRLCKSRYKQDKPESKFPVKKLKIVKIQKKCSMCGAVVPPNREKYCSDTCMKKALQDAMRKKRAEEAEKQKMQVFFKQTLCPWELGQVRGPAANADPVLGF